MAEDQKQAGWTMRTDLAVEAKEMIAPREGVNIPGVSSESYAEDSISVDHVSIQTPEAERAMNKAMGNYVNIEAPGLREKDTELQDKVSHLLAKELNNLAQFTEDTQLLVVGLGNWNVTPDAIGPRVVSELVVTRHLKKYVPENLGPGFRSMAAIAPGVLGITGLETGEIIKGVVQEVQPTMILAVDALAARSLERLNTTIQIADNGIHPGSGVGNQRMGITKESMGIPVVAMGVPTVVEASTIVNDALEMAQGQQGKPSNHNETANRQMINQALSPYSGEGHSLMVTPKEVDQFVDDIADVIAGGVNVAVHPRVAEEQGLAM